MGILQVLGLKLQKFRILEILNFHPCRPDMDNNGLWCCTPDEGYVRDYKHNSSLNHAMCKNSLKFQSTNIGLYQEKNLTMLKL